MTAPTPLAQRLAWFAEGESRLLRLLATGPELRAPSRLPGWSRAHLVAHLIGNADALGRLVHWARTGEPTPMYADAHARAAQIAADAGRDDTWLLGEAAAASARLTEAVASLAGADWEAPVRTAQGREVAATEIPWMRVRESAIHAFDLDLGAGLDGCPAALVDALLSDLTATVGAREGCPAVRIAPDDRNRTWLLGVPGGAATSGAGTADGDTGLPVVTGPAAHLLTWVAGRADDPALPALPRWL